METLPGTPGAGAGIELDADEETCRLNSALERRLAESKAELRAARDELAAVVRERDLDRLEIERLNESLARQTIALETLGQELSSFSFSVSHDLRAPLRHVLGFSKALAEHEPQLDGTAQSYLACIVRAGHKLEFMIEALLNLSRLTQQKMNFVSVDLSQMARECADALKKAGPERRVEFLIADRLTARADASLLKLALVNLFENAWKYTGKKELARIEFGRKQQGENSFFYLCDNGAGFDLSYADKLFAPFQRMHLESEFEGRGTGLATVQRIIHRHGGRIWADARVNGGATICFTLAE